MRGIKISILTSTVAKLIATQAIGRLIRFSYLIIIARFLGPAEVGIYGFGIVLYLAFMLFGNCGQNVVLAQGLHKRSRGSSRLLHHSLLLRATFTCVCALIGLGYVSHVSASDLEFRSLAWLLAAMIVRSYATWIREAFVAIENTNWIPKFEAGLRITEMLFGSCLLYFGYGLEAICVLHFLVWLLEAGLAHVRLRRTFSFRPTSRIHIRFLKRLAIISFTVTIGVASIYIVLHLATLTLKILPTSAVTIGHYVVAMQFFSTFLIFPVGIAQAVVPAMSRAKIKPESDDILYIPLIIKLGLLAGTILAVLVQAYGPFVVSSLLGSRFEATGEIFARLCWILGPYSIAIITGNVLLGLGCRLPVIAIGFAMSAIQIAIIILLPSHDIVLAAIIGLGISALAGAIALAIVLSRQLSIDNYGWWLRTLSLCVVLAGAANITPISLAVTGPLLIVAALVLWRAIGVANAELQFLIRRVRLAAPR